VAEDYDRVRPGYPALLIDAACAIGSLRPGSRVVEVGCGTGKLTSALVERRLRVEAVDPGRELIAVARRRVGESSAHFHIARFEDVELPDGAFDALFSATAFHWVDPAVGWSKAARLLRPRGVLALLTYVGGLNLEPDVEQGFRAAWREVLPEAATWEPRDAKAIWEGAEARRDNVSELWAWLERREVARPEAAELFEDVTLAKIPSEREATAAEGLAFVRTTSSYLRLDPSRQKLLEHGLAAVVENAGGTYRSTTFDILVTARVRAASGLDTNAGFS
jgi:ubiquinone/menaquinone biosynthesis C-methylase UbiE